MEKGRILVDSNVIISAIVFDANELDVLTVARANGYALILSEHVLDEVCHVLQEKFPDQACMAPVFLNLAGFSLVESRTYSHLMNAYPFLRHQKDWHVLAAAESAGCSFVVTGDNDILIAARRTKIPAMNARNAIALMNG